MYQGGMDEMVSQSGAGTHFANGRCPQSSPVQSSQLICA